jgi:hypothetical protein
VLDEVSDFSREPRSLRADRDDRAVDDRADGSIVGFIAMSIILPIFKLSSLVITPPRRGKR